MSRGTKALTKNDFLKSLKADELRDELTDMVESPLYNTHVATAFESDTAYFIEKHMKYMSAHLAMDHYQYVKNLKLMTLLRK